MRPWEELSGEHTSIIFLSNAVLHMSFYFALKPKDMVP